VYKFSLYFRFVNFAKWCSNTVKVKCKTMAYIDSFFGSLPVKEVYQSVYIFRLYDQKSSVLFFF